MSNATRTSELGVPDRLGSLADDGLLVVDRALPEPMLAEAGMQLRALDDSAWEVDVKAGPGVPPRRFAGGLGAWEECRHDRDAAGAAFARGEFGYCFLRFSARHEPDCSCALCRLPQAVLTAAVATGAAAATADWRVASHFFSWYAPGCFLGPHVDSGNGDIGFVLNLSTHDWRAQRGGVLMFDRRAQRRLPVWIPGVENSLVLFDVMRLSNSPHHVSRVSEDGSGRRLAMTGWLTPRRQPERD